MFPRYKAREPFNKDGFSVLWSERKRKQEKNFPRAMYERYRLTPDLKESRL